MQGDAGRLFPPVEDGEVVFVEAEMGDVVGDPEPQLDPRQRGVERLQPRHQPEIGDAVRAGQRHLARPGRAAHAMSDGGEVAEDAPDLRDIGLAHRGQGHAGRGAQEQLGADEAFQLQDLAADRALGQAELRPGAGEIGQPRRRLEHHECVQRRQTQIGETHGRCP
jgi:hypothetical protein